MAFLEKPIEEVLPLKNFIGGEWVESEGESKDVVNPATGKTITRAPVSTRDELDATVKATQVAFPDWRRTTLLDRSRKSELDRNIGISEEPNLVRLLGPMNCLLYCPFD